ncbi:hypothetical protein DFR87_02515 [Metallosphaera hakonensis JCM 8857 = DSM 7519]|uniref:SWIM-type domain-containing protein n=1 Tax=Metallosphaera hakonensis JCM 8857 = DSM 7519 TaxID=1293036 RepID=A0A2U9IXB4_9CREN|nr:hypothetical protein DFR87_02515 [Metallosphaera hakonensis JCM 8857 = DSM 7519]
MYVRPMKDDEVEVEAFVPARCSIKGFRTTIVIRGNKLIRGKCECGSFPCSHSSKLYLMYMRTRHMTTVSGRRG